MTTEPWRPRNLLHLVHELSLLCSREFNRRVREYGLTRPQWYVLYELYRQDGRTQSEIADALTMAKPPCGRIIDRLEAEGWVRRQRDDRDRRINRVYLTDRLEPLLPEMEAVVDELADLATRGMSAGDRGRLTELLRQAHDNLNGVVSADGSDHCSRRT